MTTKLDSYTLSKLNDGDILNILHHEARKAKSNQKNLSQSESALDKFHNRKKQSQTRGKQLQESFTRNLELYNTSISNIKELVKQL